VEQLRLQLRAYERQRGILAAATHSPDERSEILPFVGYTQNGEHQILPTVYADGLSPLPVFNEQQLLAQDWTSWGWNQLTAG